MAEYKKQVKLKKGEVVTLRRLVKDDLEKLVAFFQGVPLEDRLLLKEDVSDRKVIERWVNNIDYDHVLPIVAEYEDRIVGDATLHINQHGWTRHIGEIRGVVARDFQEKGLGTVLLKEIYTEAQSRKISKLMVQIIEEQKTAIGIFERMGFIHEAVLKGHAMDINNQKHNLIIMTNDLDALWKKMEDLIWDYEMTGGVT